MRFKRRIEDKANIDRIKNTIWRDFLQIKSTEKKIEDGQVR